MIEGIQEFQKRKKIQFGSDAISTIDVASQLNIRQHHAHAMLGGRATHPGEIFRFWIEEDTFRRSFVVFCLLCLLFVVFHCILFVLSTIIIVLSTERNSWIFYFYIFYVVSLMKDKGHIPTVYLFRKKIYTYT